MESDRPRWLESGAAVWVRVASSSGSRDYRAVVRSVDWPWLVYLDDGRPGAVHPWRLRQDEGKTDAEEKETTG
jgi:hypothetical protein